MIRKIIEIDKEKCNGCGLCAHACHEGAIGMVDGKATLLRDDYCDGLGNCLPVCPTGAITIRNQINDAWKALHDPELRVVVQIAPAVRVALGEAFGLAPGVNMSEKLAFFEATHGTAPSLAGKDRANPGSLILSGALMLEHIGWKEAATRIYKAVNTAIARRAVTEDLAAQGERRYSTSEVGDFIAAHI